MGTKAIVIGIALLAGSATQAATSVIGGGQGRECYQAAERNRPSKSGIEVCTMALETEVLTPNDRAATLVNRGIIQMQTKNLTAAIADYDAAIRIRPDTAEAYINKGIALIHLGGQEQAAVAVLTRGLAMNPSRPEVGYYTRAVANEMIGAMREAYDDYKQAAMLKPDWPEPAAQLERFKVVSKPSAGA